MINQHHNEGPFVSTQWFFITLHIFFFCALLSSHEAFAAEDFSATYKAYKGYVQSGSDYLRKGDYQQTIQQFSKAIAMSPFEATLYLNRGIARYKSGKLKDAEDDFDKALVLDPRMVSALAYRGLCREKQGKEKAALEDYARAVQQQPDDVSNQNNIAWLYATAKDEGVRDKLKALEHASKAVALSKEKNAGVLDTLARVDFINGKVKEAIDTEKKAIELEPGNKEFKENLARYERENK